MVDLRFLRGNWAPITFTPNLGQNYRNEEGLENAGLETAPTFGNKCFITIETEQKRCQAPPRCPLTPPRGPTTNTAITPLLVTPTAQADRWGLLLSVCQ